LLNHNAHFAAIVWDASGSLPLGRCLASRWPAAQGVLGHAGWLCRPRKVNRLQQTHSTGLILPRRPPNRKRANLRRVFRCASSREPIWR